MPTTILTVARLALASTLTDLTTYHKHEWLLAVAEA
jgi:hypothetical protein